jgi:DNA polymerase-3 subunit epsilon
MKIPGRLAFAIAALCVFLAAFAATITALLLNGLTSASDGGIAAVVVVTLAALMLAGSILNSLYALYPQAALRMTEEVEALASHGGVRLAEYGARELSALGRAVNQLATVRDALALDVSTRVREARASLEEERARLAALMADLNQSVIVCNLDGRILLYNERARQELSGPADSSANELLGLGRSIYTVFERSLITHVLDRLQLGLGEKSGTAQFVTVTRAGRLLRAHVSPVLSVGADEAPAVAGSTITGFVITLDDITAVNERDARRDGLIQSLTEGARGPLGNIRAAAETLSDFADMPPIQRERFLGVIREEAGALSLHLENAATAFSDDLRVCWPLEEMLGAALLNEASRRIGERSGLAVKLESVDDSIWLRIDSFGMLQAMSFLALRLQDEYDIRELRLALMRDGRLAQLDLSWIGSSMNNETAMSWQMAPMSSLGEASQLSVQDVVDRCNGELWFQRERASHRAFFRILLPAADAPKELDHNNLPARQGSRPEYYDFDLFSWSAASHELADQPLSVLSYTVFDTETTGLEPSAGDEIIQIGAARIVNRRLLSQECFDQLVDPCRTLSKESIRIHGITPDLLLGQPTIDTVLPSFHAFCADTVLVAHNAAFDMRFLQLKEERLGVRFEQPVLDTFLLSAVLHPNQESHRLEAIAERLGVSVLGRHTALGDAMVTGEIFLKMLPLLAGMGIHTLRQAREASEKTYHARLRY